MRSYLCGDEFNSVLAEENSASLRSSEVTVSTQPEFYSLPAEKDPVTFVWSSEATNTQPVPLGFIDAIDAENRQNNGDIQDKQNSTSRLFYEEAAAIIQSAFRSFLVNSRTQLELNIPSFTANMISKYQ